MPIDAIVYDIGNVLIHWDPRHLYRKIFADPSEMEWFLANVCTGSWNLEQDRGRSWAEAEAEAIARHPRYEAQIRAFRARWIEMIPEPVEGMPTLLERTRAAGLRVLAISNFAADTFEEAAVRFPFLASFEGAAISGRLGMLKPEAGIYRWLIETHDVDPTRAIFVDDSPANVAGAAAMGFAALDFTSAKSFRADLARLGVLLQRGP